LQLKRATFTLNAALTSALAVAIVGCGAQRISRKRATNRPESVRLYVFDGGILRVHDTARFQLRKEELAETDLAITCFLLVHPKGTLIWDTCAVPDSEWTATGRPMDHTIVLADAQQRVVTITEPLEAQLASVGYSPKDITFLALSHYHYDHTANANEFAGATWLVRREERDAMFAESSPGVTRPNTYAALRTSKTVLLEGEEYDVFGDGTVIIRAAVGHTPGHQVLSLKLAKAGRIVLSGDLYHYPEERTLDRVPTFEFSPEQTSAARVTLDRFLEETGAQLWMQHDLTAYRTLEKAPAFYE
jgi:glyoxylase-like metal-dependent hydrolase (beta-lactamase superfamily II)